MPPIRGRKKKYQRKHKEVNYIYKSQELQRLKTSDEILPNRAWLCLQISGLKWGLMKSKTVMGFISGQGQTHRLVPVTASQKKSTVSLRKGCVRIHPIFFNLFDLGEIFICRVVSHKLQNMYGHNQMAKKCCCGKTAQV